MFVSQPEIPVPLAIEFPFPAWATRLAECAAPVRAPVAAANGSTPDRTGGHHADAFGRLPTLDDDDIPPF
jgi:hypothetical protein